MRCFFERALPLPTTEKAFEDLITRLMRENKFLSDRNHTAAVVAVAIRHLPPHQGRVKLSYLRDYVRKNLAAYVCSVKSSMIQHKNEVDQLISILVADPADTEARDKLELAANNGSQYAKEELKKLSAPNDPLQQLLAPQNPPPLQN